MLKFDERDRTAWPLVSYVTTVPCKIFCVVFVFIGPRFLSAQGKDASLTGVSLDMWC